MAKVLMLVADTDLRKVYKDALYFYNHDVFFCETTMLFLKSIESFRPQLVIIHYEYDIEDNLLDIFNDIGESHSTQARPVIWMIHQKNSYNQMRLFDSLVDKFIPFPFHPYELFETIDKEVRFKK